MDLLKRRDEIVATPAAPPLLRDLLTGRSPDS
jgi:hypothetical protein